MSKKFIYLLSTIVLFCLLSFIRHLRLLQAVQSDLLFDMTHRSQLCELLPMSVKLSIILLGLLAGYHVGQYRWHIVYERKCHRWFKKHCHESRKTTVHQQQ